MGFDLTESELKATRKLHGLDKEKNIEEDIEKIKQLNNLLKFFRTHGWIPNMSREINTNGTIEAIEHILSELEQDKKRIKELEEENQKYIVQLTDEQYRNLVEIIRKEVKKEFEQKVKDRIEELKLSGGSNGKDNVENLARELATEVLEELLEEK